jgi:hypothetical protein
VADDVLVEAMDERGDGEMSYTYRICPADKLIIERKADPPNARWCFYRVCDSPADAKRSLSSIRGDVPVEQIEIWVEA